MWVSWVIAVFLCIFELAAFAAVFTMLFMPLTMDSIFNDVSIIRNPNPLRYFLSACYLG
jgi:hypothetical protein